MKEMIGHPPLTTVNPREPNNYSSTNILGRVFHQESGIDHRNAIFAFESSNPKNLAAKVGIFLRFQYRFVDKFLYLAEILVG